MASHLLNYEKIRLRFFFIIGLLGHIPNPLKAFTTASISKNIYKTIFEILHIAKK
jgi:hypothetical protein